jgi:hypothetical protein
MRRTLTEAEQQAMRTRHGKRAKAKPEDIPALVRRLIAEKITPMSFGFANGQEWEDVVFFHATAYTAVLYGSLRQGRRADFSTYKEALAMAQTMTDEHKRPALIYAVTEAGRQMCVGPQSRQRYLEIDEERAKQYEKARPA